MDQKFDTFDANPGSNPELVFSDSVPFAFRVLMFFGGLIPLLAPYELLYQPRWTSYFNFVFVFFVLFCAFAVGISFIFIAGALVGLDWTVQFDPAQKLLFYRWSSPVLKMREQSWPFSEIASVDAVKDSWGDGPDYYQVAVVLKHGKRFNLGKFGTMEEAQARKAVIQKLL